jgi:hypothetical protein
MSLAACHKCPLAELRGPALTCIVVALPCRKLSACPHPEGPRWTAGDAPPPSPRPTGGCHGCGGTSAVNLRSDPRAMDDLLRD